MDCNGNPTYDPKEDKVFVEILRNELDPKVEIVEIDANMEDQAFSQEIIQSALELF